MAQQRGRSQARRSGGGNGSGMPGWLWLVMGVLMTLVVVIAAPRLMKSRGDGGFFKPTPNPDAKADTAAPAEEVAPAPVATAQNADAAAKPGAHAANEDYSFYDVLPKNEVRLSDEQLAAMARDEAKRKADAAKAKPKADADQAGGNGLPQPIDTAQPVAKAEPAKTQATPHPATAAASAKAKDDDAPPPVTVAHATAADGASVPISKSVPATSETPYLLQAGAFGDAGQAEAVKAKIALLGLNARVESAQVDGRMVYRVRMGPYASAGDLAGAKSKLSGGGLAAVAVKAR